MSNDFATRLLADVLWNALLICAPVALLCLATGVIVSILQAVTQVQDATLNFVPKTIVAAVSLAAFGPWMLRRLVSFTAALFSAIPNLF